MIEVGKCKCMRCNHEFRADEAMYELKIDFEEGELGSALQQSDYGSSLSDVESYFDGDAMFESNKMPESVLINTRELVANRELERDGVVIRLVDEQHSVPGKEEKTCTDCHVVQTDDGMIKFYGTFCVSYQYEDSVEKLAEFKLDDRICPKCKSGEGIGESMGVKKVYLILMYGNSRAGKTTWLKAMHERTGRNATVMGYEIANADGKEERITAKRLAGEIPVTDPRVGQEHLCTYFQLSKANESVCFIFRDVAGDLLKYEERNNEYMDLIREYAESSDAVILFRDFVALSGVVRKANAIPRGATNISVSDYKKRIDEILKSTNYIDSAEHSNVDPESIWSDEAEQQTTDPSASGVFKNRDIVSSFGSVCARNPDLPVILVFNKTDLLKKLMNVDLDNQPAPPCSEDEGIAIPFDYRCDTPDMRKNVLTAKSSMFQDVTHYHEFDIKNYLTCAIETAEFLSVEDQRMFAALVNLINDTKADHARAHAVTAISANTVDETEQCRVIEPLAWLIELLINKTDFTGSLLEQYAKYC